MYKVTKEVLAVFDAWDDVITDKEINASRAGKAIGLGVGTLTVTKTGALRTHSSQSPGSDQGKRKIAKICT